MFIQAIPLMPLGPIISLALILGGLIAPRGTEVFPTDFSAVNFLTFLAVICGVITLGSFVLTRLWRRIL